MDPRTAVIAPIALALVTVVAACGSSDGGAALDGAAAPSVADTPEAALEPVQILRPGSIFTVDDVAKAGWKKSRELPAETLPNATSVWYGFYNRKDVEVRIYPSQESAIADGLGPADDAVGRGKPAPFAVGGISATRTSYGAYAIVGNLILMCEVQIDDCAGLLNALE